MDYQIKDCSRTCARTGRELVPGEPIYVVLYATPEGWRREDWSREAWQGPPAEAFSFWASRVPDRGEAKGLEVDDEGLLANLSAMAETADPALLRMRYVIALLLLRRKRLRLEGVEHAAGQEWLVLRETRTRNQHRVLDPRLSEQAIAEVQEGLAKQLGFAA